MSGLVQYMVIYYHSRQEMDILNQTLELGLRRAKYFSCFGCFVPPFWLNKFFFVISFWRDFASIFAKLCWNFDKINLYFAILFHCFFRQNFVLAKYLISGII